MPVNSCNSNGKPGYKWGDAGKCYIYDSKDESSKKAAKKKAIAQGIAIGDIDITRAETELNLIKDEENVTEILSLKKRIQEAVKETFEKSLTQWFRENWVDLSRPKPGGGFEPCGRPDAGKGKYPKCVPASRAARMTPAEIESAIRRKRKAESSQRREGKKPIYVSTVAKASVNIPTNPKLYAQVKAEAKRIFDVYPSAYANAWLVREYKKRGGKYKTVEKMNKYSEQEINGYPAATQSIEINIKNRQDAIDIANYGPINPDLPNEDYWQRKADQFHSSIEDAKSARCANCAAFVQTKELIDAIAEGLGGEPMSYAIIELANLGYCDIFEFKCAGLRTCDAWIAGGPVENI